METLVNIVKENYSVDVYKNYVTLHDNYFEGVNESDYDDPFDVRVTLRTIRGYSKIGDFEFDKSIKNCDNETYKKHSKDFYGSGVNSRFVRVLIERDENKISFKVSNTSYSRIIGDKFFRKSTEMFFITFSYKTKRFYVGRLENYHTKKRAKKRFINLTLSDDQFYYFYSLMGKRFTDSGTAFTKVETDELIQKFFSYIDDVIYDPELSLNENLVYHQLNRFGYKLPDNWRAFNTGYHPCKKEILKYGCKLVDTIMAYYDLKGDKLRRVLHKVKVFRVLPYNVMRHIFGEDFLLSKPDEDIIRIFESESGRGWGSLTIPLSKVEKNRAYQIYSITGDIDSIVDHCLFRVELMKYERVKWTSTNYDEFINEHVAWSEKVKLYRSKIFNRKYDNNFKGLVEQTIIDDDNTYYPVLLSNGSDYEGESLHQSNCVRTYENKPGSLIISLRKNSKIGERLTIEYKITKYGKEDELGFLKRVQTKEKFNREPRESWGGVLNKLDSRIKELCMNKLFILPEVEIRFANNKRINTTIVFNEDGHPCFGEDQDIIPFIEDIIDELPL